MLQACPLRHIRHPAYQYYPVEEAGGLREEAGAEEELVPDIPERG